MNFFKKILSYGYNWCGQRKPGFNEFEIAVLVSALYYHARQEAYRKLPPGTNTNILKVKYANNFASRAQAVRRVAGDLHEDLRSHPAAARFFTAIRESSHLFVDYIFSPTNSQKRSIFIPSRFGEHYDLDYHLKLAFTTASYRLHSGDSDNGKLNDVEFVAKHAMELMSIIRRNKETDDWWVKNVIDKMPCEHRGGTLQRDHQELVSYVSYLIKKLPTFGAK